jgi:hypothetical protein
MLERCCEEMLVEKEKKRKEEEEGKKGPLTTFWSWRSVANSKASLLEVVSWSRS